MMSQLCVVEAAPPHLAPSRNSFPELGFILYFLVKGHISIPVLIFTLILQVLQVPNIILDLAIGPSAKPYSGDHQLD